MNKTRNTRRLLTLTALAGATLALTACQSEDRGYKVVEKEMAAPVITDTTWKQRGTMTIQIEEAEPHNLGIEVTKKITRNDTDDTEIAVHDETADVSSIVTLSDEDATATLQTSNASVVMEFNPDGTISIGDELFESDDEVGDTLLAGDSEDEVSDENLAAVEEVLGADEPTEETNRSRSSWRYRYRYIVRRTRAWRARYRAASYEERKQMRRERYLARYRASRYFRVRAHVVRDYRATRSLLRREQIELQKRLRKTRRLERRLNSLKRADWYFRRFGMTSGQYAGAYRTLVDIHRELAEIRAEIQDHASNAASCGES